MMKLSDLNPYIRYANSFKTAITNPKEIRICYDCRLFFLNNVQGEFYIENQQYNLTNSTAIFLPPATRYRFNILYNANSIFTVLNFDLTGEYSHITSSLHTASDKDFSEDKILKYNICTEFKKPLIRTLPHIENILTRCIDNYIIKNDYYKETSSALLKICLLEMIKQESTGSHSLICKRILSYFRDNFMNPDLSNNDIAKALNYHPNYLNKVVKEETGKTLRQFLTYYRLQKAKDLLTTTGYSISDIAQKSGFDFPAYFTKTFHKEFNITPKEYREKNKNNLI